MGEDIKIVNTLYGIQFTKDELQVIASMCDHIIADIKHDELLKTVVDNIKAKIVKIERLAENYPCN